MRSQPDPQNCGSPERGHVLEVDSPGSGHLDDEFHALLFRAAGSGCWCKAALAFRRRGLSQPDRQANDLRAHESTGEPFDRRPPRQLRGWQRQCVRPEEVRFPSPAPRSGRCCSASSSAIRKRRPRYRGFSMRPGRRSPRASIFPTGSGGASRICDQSTTPGNYSANLP
jgi:hypothetical protein